MKTAKLLFAASVCSLLFLCSQARALTNLPFGQVTTGTVGSAAQIDYYSFAATVGDVVEFTLATTSGSLSPALRLVNPSGAVIASSNTNPTFCGSAGTELNSASLTTSGTYTVEVSDCSSALTGGYALYAQRLNNPTSPVSLTFGGTLSGTIGTAAQSDTYTLSANAGDLVDFTVHSTKGSLSPKIRLYNSAGASIASVNTNQTFCGSADAEMNTVSLSTAGTYTVLIGDCADSNTGNYDIYVQRTNSPTAATTLSFGGTGAGSITSAAQANSYTFSAGAGDVVDFTVHSTSGSLSPKIVLYNPSGTLDTSVNTNQTFCGSADAELNSVTLPVTGSYTVLVGDCADSNTGNYDIFSQRTNNPGEAVALAFGQVQSGAIASAAQGITFTFSATAGDVVDFTVHSTSGSLSPKLLLYNPDGSFNAGVNTNQTFCGSADAELNTVTLPTSGTYTAVIGDCSDSNSGDFEIYSQRTNNPTGAVTATYGQVQSGSISSESQANAFTFSGNAGDVVDFTARTTQGSVSPKIEVYNPNGLLNKSVNTNQTFCGNADAELNNVSLPNTGTYTVLVADCSDTNSGNFSFYLQSVNKPRDASSVLWGQTQTSNVGSAAYSDTWTFAGENGESANFTAVATSGNLSPKILVYDPDGSLLASANTNQTFCGNGTATLASVALAQNGNYTVLIGDCSDLNTGSYSLQSQCFSNCPLPAPILSSISPNTAVTGSSGFTLTVNGSNFVNVNANSVVQWNGSALSTTWVSTAQMKASVPSSDIEMGGIDSVTVFTPSPGGGTSSIAKFTVKNPVPVLSSISPTSAMFGSPAFTLTLTGSGFVTNSSAQWNGSSLATVYVSPTELTASVPASGLTGSCTASVTVVNPTPGGGTSASQTFAINIATPTLTSISPASTPFGGTGLTLYATGSCFVSTSTVNWNGTGLATTYVSATKLKAAVVSSDLAHAGTAAVRVENPSPGGATSSSALTFIIDQVTPVITWPTPAPIVYGTAVSATQEDATANVPGSFSYSEPLGWKPKAGTHSITVTFTPADTLDYKAAKATVALVVNQARPTITWATPAAIAYGTALSATQLDATSTVPGAFAYTPVSGTILAAGMQTLSVTLTPTDTTDYATATAAVTLTVNKATLTVAAVSASRPFGTANPTFAGTMSGFVNGDTQSVVSGSASLTTTATTTSAVGIYPIAAALGTLSAANYTFTFANGTLTITQATPAITWPKPAAITYGAALSATQLDATSKIAGTMIYSPSAGTVLNAGSQTLSVTLTPTDMTDYSTATATVPLTVNKGAPVITWPTPGPITYGTLVSGTQEDATANVPGTFSYSQPIGWKPKAGSHTISVTFTPTDSTDYKTATATVTLTVNQAMPVITWAAPASIAYGTALSASQLDATVSVPAVCSYTPPLGTVLSLGKQTLSVSCVPADSTDYVTATASVSLTVTRATPVITWTTPAPIIYGTTVSSTQEDATANVAGTFTYSQPIGWKPTAGTHSLAAYFAPSDPTDYVKVTTTVTLTVTQATPAVTWPNPAAITYGTALAATQLDAAANVPGSSVYTPALGTVLTAGSHALSVIFTPTDTTDYATATASVTLTVNQAKPVVTWPTPAPITYGTTVSAAQEDATANVPGTFVYSQPIGWKPIVGTHTLAVTFTPADSSDYKTATASVTLTVNPAS